MSAEKTEDLVCGIRETLEELREFQRKLDVAREERHLAELEAEYLRGRIDAVDDIRRTLGFVGRETGRA